MRINLGRGVWSGVGAFGALEINLGRGGRGGGGWAFDGLVGGSLQQSIAAHVPLCENRGVRNSFVACSRSHLQHVSIRRSPKDKLIAPQRVCAPSDLSAPKTGVAAATYASVTRWHNRCRRSPSRLPMRDHTRRWRAGSTELVPNFFGRGDRIARLAHLGSQRRFHLSPNLCPIAPHRLQWRATRCFRPHRSTPR